MRSHARRAAGIIMIPDASSRTGLKPNTNRNSLDMRVALVRLFFALAMIVTLLGLASTGYTAVAGAVSLSANPPAADAGSAAHVGVSTWDAGVWEAASLGDINPQVFSLALEAAASAVARGDALDPATLTVIDLSLPSTHKRLWVYGLRSHTLLFEELVAHGRGSGALMATSFSNDPDSLQSSLGLFRTGEAYVGKNGYSLRLDGLDPGVNDRARERDIVIHGAPYVDAGVARALGYLGRSWGCPAVRPAIARPLIDAVKGGGLLFTYAAANR